MTATLPQPMTLRDRLRAACTPAGEIAKPGKTAKQTLSIPSLNGILREYGEIVQAEKDLSARKQMLKADIQAMCEPQRRAFAKQLRAPLPSVSVNGEYLFVHAPPHYTKALTRTADIAEYERTLGPLMDTYMRMNVTLVQTPENVDKCLEHEIGMACMYYPTPALHAARDLDDTLDAFCASIFPSINYPRVKK